MFNTNMSTNMGTNMGTNMDMNIDNCDNIPSWITGIANALIEYYGDKIMEEYQTL